MVLNYFDSFLKFLEINYNFCYVKITINLKRGRKSSSKNILMNVHSRTIILTFAVLKCVLHVLMHVFKIV